MAALGKPHNLAVAPAVVRPSALMHSLKVEICTPAIGAEIGNVSLADAPHDADLVAELRALWMRHKVLFFRDQHVTPMEQQTFAQAFGALEPHPSLPMHPEAPMLLPLYRNLDPTKPNTVEKASRENAWHADTTYVKTPSRGAMLRCETCPDSGGDTMWANMALAYERLPERVRTKVDGLYAMHSLEQMFAAQLPYEKRKKAAAATPAVEHPVVMKHPETGEKVLFVNQAFTTHFTNYYNFADVRYGQDFVIEANHLMNFLISQAQIPEYQVRLKWRPGTVAMWDNLLTQHYAVSDYGDAPRKMLRATFKGFA
ncbi:MAG: TauD/TfdA family dioxygenase [Hyphomicrobiales bacterium]|nr:TauD/TfdA family dioxygenase [Hyphomicrobiales bacterium]